MLTDWYGLYGKSWRGNLAPEAARHPAKINFGLSEHIYKHMSYEGWISPGTVVVDPFGGIAGLAFHSMKHGCNWLGVEIEPGFVDSGNQNIELWNQRYSRMPGWGTARLVQGDSRKLLDAIREAEVLVSSPPFSDGDQPVARQFHSRDPRATQDVTSARGIGFDGLMRSDGNLSTYAGEDFWAPARQIVDQAYSVLVLGGHAVWIVKHLVKNKQLVDFPEQWRQMCEDAGFVTVHEHHAWLVEDRGTQIDLDGKHHNRQIEHKGFYRRLVESRGSPRIDWETIYCMVKGHSRLV